MLSKATTSVFLVMVRCVMPLPYPDTISISLYRTPRFVVACWLAFLLLFCCDGELGADWFWEDSYYGRGQSSAWDRSPRSNPTSITLDYIPYSTFMTLFSLMLSHIYGMV